MAGTKKRILVVEDDADTADSFALLLNGKGYDARPCYSGQECLACLNDFRPEVVLLDLAMPFLSGFDVARQIRESAEHKETPLIALTGYGQPIDRQRTQDAGFVGHLLKPATIEQIEEAIASASKQLERPHLV